MNPIVRNGLAALALLGLASVVAGITLFHHSPARGSAAIASPTPVVTPTAAAQPRARLGATLFYDGSQLVLFGGSSIDGQTVYNDVWAYRGGWQPLSLSIAPPPMSAAGAAYESQRGAVILFGASGPHGKTAVTWIWHGGGWSDATTSASPPPLAEAPIAVDEATQTVVMMGISGPAFDTPSTTWTWDGTTWIQQHPSTNPPGRIDAAMGYDPSTRTVILFGGYEGPDPASRLSDTWTWDGSNWVQQRPATSPPGGSAYGAFDTSRQTLVVLTQGQTWLWNKGAWIQAHPAHSPGYRLSESMAYDSATQQVVLFGGKSEPTVGCPPTCLETPMGDLWGWNGQDWVQIA
jgi:hypothetical protein